MMRATTTILFILTIQQGCDAHINRVSSDPVRIFEGSDAVFQWTLSEDLTSRPDFKGLIFGIWKNGYLTTYITTITKNWQIIWNPELKQEAPQLAGRMQWKGDFSKSLVAFQLSSVRTQDQMDYGVMLDFGALRGSETNFLRLQIEGAESAITAGPSERVPVAPGKNISFHCEFHVGEVDQSLYDGITVGLWGRGGIYRNFFTLTKEGNIIMNPNLDQEAPGYNGRVHATYRTNSTSNTSMILVVLTDVQESDERTYGCSISFGAFKEPIGSSVKIDMQDTLRSQQLHSFENNSQKSLEVHVRKYVWIPCPVLSEVIKLDGTFKALYWSYCVSKSCTTTETKWMWLAGMNSRGIIKVTHQERYLDRVNLTLNGSLKISRVSVTDATDYRCTVRRINYTSPRVYFVTLRIDSKVPPMITIQSPGKITVNEGNVLYLQCRAVGDPKPLVTWSKNGVVLQNRTIDTNFVREDISEDDAGNYECVASNSAGSDSYRVEVIIKGNGNVWTITGIVIAIGVLLIVGIIAFCCKRKNFCKNNFCSPAKYQVNK